MSTGRTITDNPTLHTLDILFDPPLPRRLSTTLVAVLVWPKEIT